MEGITIVFLNPRKAESTCIAHGLLHNDSERRLLQYRAVMNNDLRLIYAKELIQQKLRGQRAMLLKARHKRPDQRYRLTAGIRRLNTIEARLAGISSIKSLRGIEGAAGAAYFEAFQAIFPASLAFTGRNRRPPRDPVNVTLSLSYTLLHVETTRVLVACGFDPQLGIYHLPVFGRESLACDLMEIFRPLVDLWVWRLFADEVLRRDQFSFDTADETAKPCLLGKAGRAAYYGHYEQKAQGWRKLLRKVAKQWLARLQMDLAEPVSRMPRSNIDFEGATDVIFEGEP